MNNQPEKCWHSEHKQSNHTQAGEIVMKMKTMGTWWPWNTDIPLSATVSYQLHSYQPHYNVVMTKPTYGLVHWSVQAQAVIPYHTTIITKKQTNKQLWAWLTTTVKSSLVNEKQAYCTSKTILVWFPDLFVNMQVYTCTGTRGSRRKGLGNTYTLTRTQVGKWEVLEYKVLWCEFLWTTECTGVWCL